jgi:hypothetical protein
MSFMGLCLEKTPEEYNAGPAGNAHDVRLRLRKELMERVERCVREFLGDEMTAG